MGKRNRQGTAASVLYRTLRSNQLAKRHWWQKPLDRQPAHWDEKLWLDDAQLAVQPISAARLLFTRGNSIAATARMRPRETARNGGEVNDIPSGRLIDARALEPPEQRATGTARKRNASFGFDFSWSLTDQHHLRIRRLRYDRPDYFAEATPAAARESGAMSVERERSCLSVHDE